MSRLWKLTIAALLAAVAGTAWKRRGWLFYIYATWRESRD
ncbi:hypothetical protein SAMN05216251_107305 [Actinacidiphila alni]|uniref:Uncharacterized protein n=1 Tax=Actinacidiphila alni TaxID=380248 RepID=A0A1I2FDD9_9ACTN|nr:hypothetical protein SAMN05216251_107305 [Actinacidiphila alni]